MNSQQITQLATSFIHSQISVSALHMLKVNAVIDAAVWFGVTFFVVLLLGVAVYLLQYTIRKTLKEEDSFGGKDWGLTVWGGGVVFFLSFMFFFFLNAFLDAAFNPIYYSISSLIGN